MSSTPVRGSSKTSRTGGQATVWITGDQLLAEHPALRAAEEVHGRDGLVVALIESRARRVRLPYHRHKQVLVLSAMRHYAEDLRGRGYQVDYLQSASITEGLKAHVERVRPPAFYTMAASEFGARRLQSVTIPTLFASLGGDP